MLRNLLTRIFIAILYLISLLPFKALLIISDILYLFLYYIVGYRKPVVISNLKNSFPNKSDLEIISIAKNYFSYLCDLIVETIKLITISKATAQKHFQISNPEMINYYTSKGRNVIVVAGHYGNWEMANVISFCTNNKLFVVYKPLSNVVFNNFLNKVRAKFKLEMVPMKGILRKLAIFRKEATVTILLSDQTPVRHEVQYYTQFLNQRTAVFLGVEKIAKMNNSVILFFNVQCVNRGYYIANFETLIENPLDLKEYEITELHVKHLEKVILNQPIYWTWSHRRWKF